MKTLLVSLLLAACSALAILPNGLGLSNVSLVAAATPAGGGGTSYANAGGTGDRTASITTSTSGGSFVGTSATLIDGNTTNTGFYFTSPTAGHYIQFDLGSAKVIDELKWYQSGAYDQGVWNLTGSNDGSSFTSTNDFTLGSASVNPTTHTITNTTAYRYYRLTKVSGSTSSTPWLNCIEFKIST